MNHERHAGGFTLMEVLVVVLIVGVLTTMAAPLFSPGRWRVDGAIAELTLTLNGAQRLAVLRQHDVVVRFLSGSGSIRIHQDRNNDGAIEDGEDVRIMELPETVGFARGEAPALAVGSADVSFREVEGAPELVFHRNGSASEEGVVYLRPVIGSLSDRVESTRAVTVVRATGTVECHSYRTGAWGRGC